MYHSVLHVQHGVPLVEEEGIGYINIATIPPPTSPIHSSTIPLLCTLPRLFEWVRQWHLQPPILFTISNGRHSARAYGRFTSTLSDIEAVGPSKPARFCDSFRTVVHSISEVLSSSRAAVANGHWMKWAELCLDMALYPLLILYRDPVPILNTFTMQYRTVSLAPSGHQVRYCTVEDAVQYIGQALVAMGTPDPRLTIQGEIDIWILFQYWCYIKQDPPPNWVKTTPLQVLCHISSMAKALGYPLLMAKSNMIIIFILHHG